MNVHKSIVAGTGAALVAVTLAAGPAQAAIPPPPARSVLQSGANAVVAAGAPGVLVAVRDEHGTWTGAAGVGDITTGSRPASHGQFRIGSITKSFTATMVLQLVAEGQVALDAPIETYLPGLELLQQTGFDRRRGLDAIGAVVGQGVGYGLLALRYTDPVPDATEPESNLQRIRRITRTLPADVPDPLVELAVDLTSECDTDRCFAISIEALLAGLAPGPA
jgi:hypothetical protein